MYNIVGAGILSLSLSLSLSVSLHLVFKNNLHQNTFSGYLTTRGTLLSLIWVLAKRPDLQKSLQREVDGVIGQDREPRLSDRENCPLLEAVVMETLRYISHIPVLILHATSQATTIGGYNVAKGTVVRIIGKVYIQF